MKNHKKEFKFPAKQPKNAVPAKQKQHEVLAWVLAGLMIFWTVASVFGIIGFARTGDKSSDIVTANAATWTEINQGQYYLEIPLGTVFATSEPVDLSLTESFFAALYIPYFEDIPLTFKIYNGSRLEWGDPSAPFQYAFVTVGESPNEIALNEPFYYPVNAGVDYLGPVELILYAGKIGSSDMESLTLVSSEVYLTSTYITRDNQGYYDQGYQEGYDDGYEVGDNAGYNRGWNEGVESAGEYTFMGLMSSVIDAPVQAFVGLFNFELLGVNVAGFALAMLSLCAVLAVLRVVIK